MPASLEKLPMASSLIIIKTRERIVSTSVPVVLKSGLHWRIVPNFGGFNERKI